MRRAVPDDPRPLQAPRSSPSGAAGPHRARAALRAPRPLACGPAHAAARALRRPSSWPLVDPAAGAGDALRELPGHVGLHTDLEHDAALSRVVARDGRKGFLLTAAARREHAPEAVSRLRPAARHGVEAGLDHFHGARLTQT